MITIEYIEDTPMWVQMIVWFCIGVIIGLPHYIARRAMKDSDAILSYYISKIKDSRNEMLELATRHSNEQRQLIDIYKCALEEKSRKYYELLNLKNEE